MILIAFSRVSPGSGQHRPGQHPRGRPTPWVQQSSPSSISRQVPSGCEYKMRCMHLLMYHPASITRHECCAVQAGGANQLKRPSSADKGSKDDIFGEGPTKARRYVSGCRQHKVCAGHPALLNAAVPALRAQGG